MYTTPKYVPKIRLLKDTGEVWEYKNLAVAAKELLRLGFFNRRGWGEPQSLIGEQFNVLRRRPIWDAENIEFNYHLHYEYVVRTDLGDVVTVQQLRDALPKKRSRWFFKEHQCRHRIDPVPGIHKSSTGGYYRAIHTTPERRDAAALEHDEEMIEYGIRVRAKRSNANLPNSWDDIPNARRGKNWKNFRKTQWKEPRV